MMAVNFTYNLSQPYIIIKINLRGNYNNSIQLLLLYVEYFDLFIYFLHASCLPSSFLLSFPILSLSLLPPFFLLSSISETPELQLWISQQSAVINQALAVAKSSHFTCDSAAMAVSLLLCLAQCPEAHINLLKPDIIDKLTEACSLRRTKTRSSQVDDVMALE